MAETTTRISPTTSAGSVSVQNPNNSFASDDNRSILDAQNDELHCSGFTAPGAHADIKSVLVGFEGNRGGGGGGNAAVTLSYEVSGVPGPTTSTFLVGSTNDSIFPTGLMDITADRAWTATDIANLKLIVTRDSTNAGFKDVQVDHLFVDLTEEDPPGSLTLGDISQLSVGPTAAQANPPAPVTTSKWETYIKADFDNTDLVYIGTHNGVSETDGWPLAPGEVFNQLYETSTVEPVEFYAYSPTVGQRIATRTFDVII